MNTTKNVSESKSILTELVLPNDTNMINNLMGGRLMYLMDVIGAISAQKHTERLCVTASVDNVSFEKSIPLGSIVTLEASITRAFNTSLEVYIEVFAENIPSRVAKYKTNEAFMTFVAVDDMGNPVKIPAIETQNKEEEILFESALKRRQIRLLLSGKIKKSEITDFNDFFNPK